MRQIDADALKEKARELIPQYHASLVMNLFDLIDNLVDNLPTIDPPQGEWEERIVEDAELWFRRRFYCSNCGGWNTYGMTRYCPDCGAKMAVKE